jgi:hypothetical protein
MIYFNFSINWPWPKSYGQQDQIDYIGIEKVVTKNKAFSMQLSKSCNFHTVFGISLNTKWWGEDHGGIRFGIEIYRYFFDIGFYDMRHWNWDAKRWYTEEEAKAEYEEWQKDIDNG